MKNCRYSQKNADAIRQGSDPKTIDLRHLLFFGSMLFISIACSLFSSPGPIRVTPGSLSQVSTTPEPGKSTSIPTLNPPGSDSTRMPGTVIASTVDAATQPYPVTSPPAYNSATPGLLIHGKVTGEDGRGLADVLICRRFASYPGTPIATTDTNGTFSADISFIPGDEMVAVWPELVGFRFEPPHVYWRHYYGFEETTLEFTASQGESTVPSCR